MKLKVEYYPIESLKPYEHNAKLHPQEQIDQIKRSIKEFGMNDPIAIWGEDNIIIEGHGRLMACQELGMKEVPIIRLDDLTDEERRAYTLVHNQTTMNTGFDMEILMDELQNIEIDMEQFGFEDIELDDIEEDREIIEDEVPEIPEEPVSKRGDIYKLGNHNKVADRIAGAIVDLAYTKAENPKVAVEVLIGHGSCHIIVETSENIKKKEVKPIIERIVGRRQFIDLVVVPQDKLLAGNQKERIRCGDNGIFKGVPLTKEQKELSQIAREIYQNYPTDGKYILDGKKLIICQSNADSRELELAYDMLNTTVNPLGDWTGGTNVDTGATNRKLGSDMADSVTGGGLHGKDLSKADVSVNIYAFLKAQETGKTVKISCAIGDDTIDGKPYEDIVEIARKYIKEQGGFEKFAEWGLF